MKTALKNKWFILAALVLVAGMLFATTLHVYGMNDKFNTALANIQSVDRVKKEAAKTFYVHQVIDEVSAAMVEPVVEVAAAPVEEAEPEVVEDEYYVEEEYYEEEYVEPDYSSVNNEYYSPGELRSMGVIYSGGWRWTWYSQNVLPGGGLAIPGRHVDENGYVCDENGRICLASSDLGWGTVVSTPFGKEGCVYDSGCDSGTLDVYVDF